MTAYEDTIEFGGAGEVSAVAKQTLQETITFGGAGAPAAVAKQTLQETITFGGAGEFVPAHAYMFIDLDLFNIESWRVSKTIQDVMWKFSAPIDKLITPAYFKNLRILATDHNAVDNCVFIGFIPSAGYTRATAADKAMLNGFDYGWYLAKQFVPEAIRITDEDTNPAATIETLLGGASWAGTTGIEPYEIRDVADWANIKKEYVWTSKTTKWKAIEEICEHTHHVFLLKWRKTANNEYYSSAYFVHEDEIDTYLDLPAMVTVTNPDLYLMSGVRIEDKQEEKYNRVICKGANKITGDWFDKTIESAGVTAGDELPIEYVYESTDMDDQTKTDAKAQELYDFFHTVAKVYSASFKKRMDLQLYQKIKFVGYDNISTDEMRITGISYRRNVAEDIVDIQFTPDQKLSDLRKLIRSMGADFMSEQQRIKEDFFIDLTKIAMGTTQEVISASEANFTLEKDAGLVNARTIEQLSIGDAAMLFPLEGMKDNIVGLKVISGAIEGDYTSWIFRGVFEFPDCLDYYHGYAWMIDDINDKIYIAWCDENTIKQAGLYSLPDFTLISNDVGGPSCIWLNTWDDLPLKYRAGNVANSFYSRSLISYFLMESLEYPPWDELGNFQVWRDDSAPIFGRNINDDTAQNVWIEEFEISPTGKYILIAAYGGSPTYCEGGVLLLYEGQP